MKALFFQYRHRVECVIFWLCHLIAAAGLVALWSWPWLLAAVAWTYVLTIVGQEAGAHRYFSHRSYEVAPPVTALLAFLSSIVFFGGPVNWAMSHIMHHRHADTELDTTSPKYMSGWWIYLNLWKWNHRPIDMTNLAVARRWWRDTRDPVIGFFYRYYFHIAAAWWLFCLALSLEMFVYIAVIPSLLTQYLMNSVSYLGHSSGRSSNLGPFEAKDQSCNSRLLNALCPGLGYHNSHHRDPRALRCGRWDLSWVFIALVARAPQPPRRRLGES
jgi:stearoyl-CoA desaturase (delta-9 desaturase)